MTGQLYTEIWRKVLNIIPDMRNNIQTVMVDYERAAINAITEIFPNARISGCLFHYKQVNMQKKTIQILSLVPIVIIEIKIVEFDEHSTFKCMLHVIICATIYFVSRDLAKKLVFYKFSNFAD